MQSIYSPGGFYLISPHDNSRILIKIQYIYIYIYIYIKCKNTIYIYNIYIYIYIYIYIHKLCLRFYIDYDFSIFGRLQLALSKTI